MLPDTLDTAPPSPPRAWYAHLYVQVLVAIAAGVAIGHFAPATGEALKPLGDAFIKLVKMVIAPIIFLTIVSGIARRVDTYLVEAAQLYDRLRTWAKKQWGGKDRPGAFSFFAERHVNYS